MLKWEPRRTIWTSKSPELGPNFAIDHGVNGEETCSEDIRLALGLEGTGSDAAASKEDGETDDGLEGVSLS